MVYKKEAGGAVMHEMDILGPPTSTVASLSKMGPLFSPSCCLIDIFEMNIDQSRSSDDISMS